MSATGGRRETEVADDLRYQNDMKNTLLHAVSHDLKGPLAGVLGAMQTIRRAEKLHLTDKEMEDLYGVIEQAGAKAARLVEDLLDLDRLDRGQIEPQREPTDVESIADRLAAVLDREVRLEGSHVPVPERRRPQLDALRVGMVRVLCRMAQQAAAVRRVVQARLRLLDAGALVVLRDGGDLVVHRGLAGHLDWAHAQQGTAGPGVRARPRFR